MSAVRVFLEDIKIEHTLFGLPFAFAGALLAQHGLPPARTLFWIAVAVIGARTAAMAANRLLDARLDAKNPRTAARALPSGRLPSAVMIWATVSGVLVLTLAASQLNPLCLALAPVGAAAVVLYPLAKRLTWAVHFVLGAVDALAPLGAWIAVTGRFEPGALLLFVAVTVWVAGFDILYALMDREFDLREGVQSLPARFGEAGGRALAQSLHALLVVALAALGIVSRVPALYWAGVVAAIALLGYELLLIRHQRDVFRLNAAVFKANMAFSVTFFLTTAAAVVRASG